MRAAELHKFLARHTGYSVREIDERTRWMHRFEIPAGRGRSAPHLDDGVAVQMILSLVARRAVDAEKVAKRARALAAVPRSGAPARFQKQPAHTGRPVSLWLAITGVMIDAISGLKRDEAAGVEVSEDGGTAWLSFTSGQRLLFTDNKTVTRTVKKDPELYDKHRQDGIDRRLYIGAGFLKDLAIRMTDHIKVEEAE